MNVRKYGGRDGNTPITVGYVENGGNVSWIGAAALLLLLEEEDQ